MLCLITFYKVCSKYTVCYSEIVKDLLACPDCIKNSQTINIGDYDE